MKIVSHRGGNTELQSNWIKVIMLNLCMYVKWFDTQNTGFVPLSNSDDDKIRDTSNHPYLCIVHVRIEYLLLVIANMHIKLRSTIDCRFLDHHFVIMNSNDYSSVSGFEG